MIVAMPQISLIVAQLWTHRRREIKMIWSKKLLGKLFHGDVFTISTTDTFLISLDSVRL